MTQQFAKTAAFVEDCFHQLINIAIYSSRVWDVTMNFVFILLKQHVQLLMCFNTFVVELLCYGHIDNTVN